MYGHVSDVKSIFVIVHMYIHLLNQQFTYVCIYVRLGLGLDLVSTCHMCYTALVP